MFEIEIQLLLEAKEGYFQRLMNSWLPVTMLAYERQ